MTICPIIVLISVNMINIHIFLTKPTLINSLHYHFIRLSPSLICKYCFNFMALHENVSIIIYKYHIFNFLALHILRVLRRSGWVIKRPFSWTAALTLYGTPDWDKSHISYHHHKPHIIRSHQTGIKVRPFHHNPPIIRSHQPNQNLGDKSRSFLSS